MSRRLLPVLLVLLFGMPAAAQGADRKALVGPTGSAIHAVAGPPVQAGRTAAVRSLPVAANDAARVVPEGLDDGGAPSSPTTDERPQVQMADSLRVTAALAPSGLDAPVVEFAGQSGGTPPDTVGDVGPNHYVQMVNTTFQIWDKSGNSLAGPTNINSLWTSNAVNDGKCDTQNAGDPIVLYDQAADRFMLSQFSSPNSGAPFLMCIAYSQTADPTGAYFTYAFTLSDSNDYMKFGIWPDGLYMSVFEGGGQNGAYVFDRTTMLAGGNATSQYFGGITDGAQPRGMRILPSDWDGTVTPPAGAPNYFVQSLDGAYDATNDRLEIFEAHVDWATPANSTFTNVTDLATNPFSIDIGCTDDDGDGAFRNCVPQPNTTMRVDNIANRLMHRLQYRNFGTHQSMVTTQTIDDGSDRHVLRWYELRKVGASPWSIFQQGTYGPGTAHRWMGSMAMDRFGNIALGYSISDPANTVFPSIAYTGRRAGDPLGQLPEPEQTLFSGTGSQTNADRWGDYSAMSVDPLDDCTFWYTQQHSGNRATRIGAFRFAGCAPAVPTQASPGNLLGAPIRDVATLSGAFNPTGTLTFRAFGPNNANCLGAAAFTGAVAVNGNGVYNSAWFTPTAVGTYRWTVSYSGDTNNSPASSPCNAPNESVAIAPFAPPPCTSNITGDHLGPLSVGAGQSVCVSNARVVGPVTVQPGGALTMVASAVTRGMSANAPAFFSLCGTDVSGPSPATALSVTNAEVPIRIGDPAAGCARNRFAGQVSVLDNLAVTFGSNQVSHNATFQVNGPGNTVIKGNTVFGTLGCTGNDPVPTNAGQPNTAGSKNGQCVGL